MGNTNTTPSQYDLDKIFFSSGVIWLVWSGFLLLLYAEQKKFSRYPHTFIMQCLFLHTLLRTIFFFGEVYRGDKGSMIYTSGWSYAMYVINRFSILLQFTAISFLILMWSRALKVSSIEDKRSRKRPLSSLMSAPGNTKGATRVSPIKPDESEATKKSDELEGDSENAVVSPISAIAPASLQSSPVSDVAASGPDNPLANIAAFEAARAEETKQAEAKYVYYFRINLAINMIVYLFIFVILVAYRSDAHLGSKEQVYEFDIECLGFLCLAEALVILASGIKTAYDLSYEMTPIFVTRSNNSQQGPSQGRSRRIYSSIKGIPALLFRPNSTGLELQRQVLQNLILVSCVISIFFLIRAVAFMYIPVIVDYDHQTAYYDSIYTYSYPLCFYQLPEFFPDLAIIIGIAQRGGIVNRLLRCAWCSSDGAGGGGAREMNLTDLMKWQTGSRSPSQTSNNTSNLDAIFTISEHFQSDGFGNSRRASRDSVYSDFQQNIEREDDSFASSGKVSFQLSSFSSSNSTNSSASKKNTKPNRLDEKLAEDHEDGRPRV